eukprot:3002623-Alexandrium_andersonii.AAC.1
MCIRDRPRDGWRRRPMPTSSTGSGAQSWPSWLRGRLKVGSSPLRSPGSTSRHTLATHGTSWPTR